MTVHFQKKHRPTPSAANRDVAGFLDVVFPKIAANSRWVENGLEAKFLIIRGLTILRECIISAWNSSRMASYVQGLCCSCFSLARSELNLCM